MLIITIIDWSVRRFRMVAIIVTLLFLFPDVDSQNVNTSLVPLKVRKG